MKYLYKISRDFYMYHDKKTDSTYSLQKGSIGVLSAGSAWRLRVNDRLIACFVIRSDGYEYERQCYGGRVWSLEEVFFEADKMVARAILRNTAVDEIAVINDVLEDVKTKYNKSVKENGGYDGRTDSYGYKMQINILEEVLRRIAEESGDDKAKLQHPECFASNKHPYPLCVGGNMEKCKKCCLNERYEEYNDPYENFHK